MKIIILITFFLYNISLSTSSTNLNREYIDKSNNNNKPNNEIDSITSYDVFPWGSQKDVLDRSDDILESLRNDMHLNIFEKVIPKALLPNNKHIDDVEINNDIGIMYMKNLEGQRFSSFIKQFKPDKMYNYNNNKKIYSTELYDIDALTNSLNDMCTFLSGSWWNYEWCHKKEIRQFHIDIDTVTNIANRNPDYSLGLYHHTEILREDVDMFNLTSPIIKMIDYFRDGQQCDENRNFRKTEVHFLCCDNISKNSNKDNKSNKLVRAVIDKVQEIKLCHYQMNICVPSMCMPKDPILHKYNDKSTLSLVKIMHELNKTCLTKQEDWWTYELCFGVGLRQFHIHIENVKAEDSNSFIQKQSIQSQFILGKAPVQHYRNESYLRTISLKKQPLEDNEKTMKNLGITSPVLLGRSKKPNSLKLEFIDDGTPCDLINLTRSSTVEIICGEVDKIIDIHEDKTCHYHIIVHSKLACNYKDLQPIKDNIHRVDFIHEASASASNTLTE
jgi:hypothetical protein